jgi:hypothetical protein
LQPQPEQSIKVIPKKTVEEPGFLNKYNLKKIPDMSMDDDNFDIYDQYDE